jgi:adenosylcobinamide kinase/adenosylcobinamide-phosphate guanylyltransferase
MHQRIKRHIKLRPGTWKTITVEKELPETLEKVPETFDVVIIDCLTLFISNLLLSNIRPAKILTHVKRLCKAIKKIKQSVILISNEVGCGIVPENKLARMFRDIAGEANQILSNISDKVYVLWGGIPVEIKEAGDAGKNN